jgi:hypothetical protein
MNARLHERRTVRTAKRIFGLAGLASLMLFCAGVAGAQSKPAQTEPTAARSAATALATSTGVQSSGVAPAADGVAQDWLAKSPAPKRQHEGITVHGHWTIEVKNPDGTRVSREEFENSLVQPSGSEDLTLLLLGSYVPGGYTVALYNSGVAGSGPCPSLYNGYTLCLLVGSLTSPTPTSFVDYSDGCGNAVNGPITPAGPCFPLSITPALGTTGIAFSGTAVATNTATSITDVSLTPLFCPFPTNPPTGAVVTASPNACSQGGNSGTVGGLTHATLPSPVQITAVGQSIAVTVQISFQ